MARSRHAYLDLVTARAPEPVRAWLERRLESLGENDFGLAYAGAGRRLGSGPVTLTDEETRRLAAAGLPAPLGWPLSAVGRAALLCLACDELDGDARRRLAERVFRTGDNDERAALLKSLVLLPEPEAFVELGIDACRSHVQGIFEAIACENPYPSRFFPEHNFNQLVLKAFFTGVAVARIEGLGGRRSPELTRMALAYASERRAAGRSVPADLNFVTGDSVSADDNAAGGRVTGLEN